MEQIIPPVSADTAWEIESFLLKIFEYGDYSFRSMLRGEYALTLGSCCFAALHQEKIVGVVVCLYPRQNPLAALLGLTGIEIPDTVEGTDFSAVVRGAEQPKDNAALITCPSPFGQWKRNKHGGREYRGVRTKRYTYVRDLNGPWLLYDNQRDPFQLNNLCNRREHSELQKELEGLLSQKLRQTNDEFLSGPEYIEKWNYIVDSSGTVEYLN